jgi:quinol monooxygenase YgiN
MKTIQVNAKFTNITSANLAEFKKVAAEALEITKGEQGVLQYDWFLNDDETVCVVLETYQDPHALLAHITNTDKVFAKLIELGGACELQMFGNPPTHLDATPTGLQRSLFASYLQGK